MITISWLRPQPPTVTQWREKVKDVYYMENITARLHFKMDVFLNRWSPITSYFIDWNDSWCDWWGFFFPLQFNYEEWMFVYCMFILSLSECRSLPTFKFGSYLDLDIVRMSKSMDYLYPIYCVVSLNVWMYMTAPDKGKEKEKRKKRKQSNLPEADTLSAPSWRLWRL